MTVVSHFERWKREDKEWETRNIETLKIVFDEFRKSGEWPQVSHLQRLMDQRGERSISVVDILKRRSPLPGWLNYGPPASFILNYRDLYALMEDSTPLVQQLMDWVVVAAKVGVEAYLRQGELLPVTSIDVLSLWPLNEGLSSLAWRFMTDDFPSPWNGGGLGESGWRLNVARDRIMEFEEATTYSSYLDAQMRIVNRTADRLVTTDLVGGDRASDDSEASPLRSFIAMPFREAWSDKTFMVIKEVASEIPFDVYRLDELSFVGRITEKLIQEISGCDVLIADITGENPNVFWEIGYAHACNKQVLILRQHSDSPVPFDIYDHRRLEYSPEWPAHHRDELARLLRGLLGDAG